MQKNDAVVIIPTYNEKENIEAIGYVCDVTKEEEVKNIFNIIGVKTPKETIKIDFAEGDYVKILKGSFKDQEGQVAEIDNEHGRVKVMVDIFGRMTPVEIEVDGVLKV